MSVEQVLTIQNDLSEGALASVEEGLYWVDIERRLYQTYAPHTGAYEQVQVGVRVGVLAFRRKGRLYRYWSAVPGLP